MFGDLMGNMESQKAAMRERLKELTVSVSVGGGAVSVKANAAREILEIQIDREQLDWEDVEQVQELVTVAVNQALEKAAEVETVEAQKMIKDLLPPGMGDLGNLFG